MRGLAVGCALAVSRLAAADDDTDYDLTAALRGTLVLSHAPDDPALFPQRNDGTSLWRLRLMGDVKPTESLSFDGAYEQRASISSGNAALVGFGVLPSQAPAPYRVTQLDWSLASGDGYSWRQEIDRLSAEYKTSWANMTLGRQAIGWGRGVLFSAVDLFAPFSPLEIDRDWRRGIDAARAEVTFNPKLSADAVGAFGDSVDSSAYVGRVRGYLGPADFEVVGGWRARDVMVGITSSASILDAEVHGELAVFRAPEPLPAGGQLDPRTAIKAVAGGSYRIAVGNGLLLLAEYHYNGFGAADASEMLPLLSNPAFVTRLVRGDMQILGRHAIALLASYDVSPELQLGLRWIQSPVDGSGVAAPTATATLSDRLAVIGAIYVPYGAAPSGVMLQSEYGATALTAFVQLQASY